MKTCSKCGETKPLEEFQVRSSNKDGHSGQCKKCKREYDNAHYKANPERRDYIRQNSEARKESIRKWIYSYLLAHPCVDCGESDPIVLEFDHIRDKEFNLANMVENFGLPRVQLEVAKCEIRCANCHRKKTANDFGWWKTLVMPA